MEVTGTVNLAEKFPDALPPEPEQDAFIKDACTRLTDAYLAPVQLRNTTLTLIYTTISLPSWSAGSRQVACSIGATLGNGGWATLVNSAKGPLLINGQPPGSAAGHPAGAAQPAADPDARYRAASRPVLVVGLGFVLVGSGSGSSSGSSSSGSSAGSSGSSSESDPGQQNQHLPQQPATQAPATQPAPAGPPPPPQGNSFNPPPPDAPARTRPAAAGRRTAGRRTAGATAEDRRRAGRTPAPGLTPVAVRMDPHRFDELVSDALDLIPAELAAAIDNVVVLVEDRHPEEPDLLGLYEGVALTERDSSYAGSLPDTITIYRGALLEMCDSEDEVVDEVGITVIHEIAHHFGIDDDRLHELGWA